MEAETKEKLTMLGLIIITCITASLGIFYVLDSTQEKISNSKTEKAKLLGEMIVIGKDTLIIVDYSILKSSYILSNGKEIDSDYAKKMLVPKR